MALRIGTGSAFHKAGPDIEKALDPVLVFYSTTLSIQLKRAIAQIHTSSHDLEIERGRRHRPKPTPANERYCKKCIHKVEDETHFISECPLYTIPRTELLPHTNISQSPTTFFSQIFKSREDSVLRKLAIYITRAQLLRKETLYKLNNYFLTWYDPYPGICINCNGHLKLYMFMCKCLYCLCTVMLYVFAIQ